MLSKVLFACEAGARAALAVIEWAEERLLGSAMHLVHLTLMAQEAAAVCEALQLLTAWHKALVRAVMLVHVLAVIESAL